MNHVIILLEPPYTSRTAIRIIRIWKTVCPILSFLVETLGYSRDLVKKVNIIIYNVRITVIIIVISDKEENECRKPWKERMRMKRPLLKDEALDWLKIWVISSMCRMQILKIFLLVNPNASRLVLYFFKTPQFLEVAIIVPTFSRPPNKQIFFFICVLFSIPIKEGLPNKIRFKYKININK